MKTFLHVGCDSNRKDNTAKCFNTADWNELRLDIDESVNPDIVGTMLDTPDVEDASVERVCRCRVFQS